MNTNHLKQLRQSAKCAGVAARRCHYLRGDVAAGRYMARCALDQLRFMRQEIDRLASELRAKRVANTGGF